MIILAIAFLITTTSGCVSPTFVLKEKPSLIQEIGRNQNPPEVAIRVEWQVNGEPEHDEDLLKFVERRIRTTIKNTGVFVPVGSNPSNYLLFRINNRADIGAATKKGLLHGITFGGVEVQSVDNYDATLTVVLDGNSTTVNVAHEMYGIFGNPDKGGSMEAVAGDLIRQLVIEALYKYQLAAKMGVG